MKSVSDIQFAQIVADIQAMYASEVPPPEKVTVVRQSLCKDEEDPQYYNALIYITINWCGNKSHAVKLKFKWHADTGLRDMQYVSIVNGY
jgi:hypothetical protein